MKFSCHDITYLTLTKKKKEKKKELHSHESNVNSMINYSIGGLFIYITFTPRILLLITLKLNKIRHYVSQTLPTSLILLKILHCFHLQHESNELW